MKTKDKIGGVNIAKIAATIGTPTYIYDEEEIRERMKVYVENFKSELFETRIIYASKAFLCSEIVHIASEIGLGLDVVSGGELYCAEKGGMMPSQIYFHGNNKSEKEIRDAFNMGIGRIVADNEEEVDLIIKIAENLKKNMSLLLRINPGIEAHTHDYIATARKDSKFGVDIDDNERIMRIAKKIEGSKYLEFSGVHAHIGSQIFRQDAFISELKVLTSFMKELKEVYNIEINELDMGGGFAVRYTDKDSPLPIDGLCREIINACEREVAQHKLPLKRLTIEPGRSIVGEAGYTLYEAGFTKKAETKEYIFVDGGMSDNIRPALYEAEYYCENVTKCDEKPCIEYVVAGKCCESGDVLIKNILLPKTEQGDLILVHTTGAYGYSMASNYNRLGRPPVIFAGKGKARCVIRREEYADMCALEVNEEII